MKPVILLRLLPVIALCGFLFLTVPAADLAPFADITPTQAAALIKEKGADPLFIILDVRTAAEFAESRIKGALNIDIKASDFMEKMGKLDKNGVYLAYCRGGGRSAKAMMRMKEWGFKQVYNLAGGIMKWQEKKLPLETDPVPAAARPPADQGVIGTPPPDLTASCPRASKTCRHSYFHSPSLPKRRGRGMS